MDTGSHMEKDRFAALHLFVSGMVQGVGFRFFTINRANRFGVSGWVRNLYDGRVEIEAEGRVRNLLLFLEEVKIGPASAHVSRVIEEWQERTHPRYPDFGVSH
jgi:acylphosphatase